MPLVRATLATALPTVQQLVGDLRKAVREAGSGGAFDQVLAGTEALDAYCGRKLLELEVVTTGPLSADEAGAVVAALAPGFPSEQLLRGVTAPVIVDCPGAPLDVRAQIRPLSYRAASKAGTPRPPILILVAARPPVLSADDRAALDRLFEDRPQVLLAGPPEAEHLKDLEARVRALAWTCLKVDPAAPPEQSHAARLSAPPFDAFPDLFRAHAAAGALESLVSVLGMAVEQQQREIRVNKSVLQQKLAKFQQKTPASPAADITAEIKARTQRLAGEFERGAAERLQELLGQPMGSLARELEGMVTGLGELEQQAKTATIGTRVPPDFEERINRTIRERVARHCAQDLVAINDLFRMIAQDVERTLEQAGGPPVAANFRYLTDERVRRMLDAYGAFQSPYRGEIPAKGFGDYFASVRKYSMFLVMGASMFGMSALLRQYREIVFPVTLMIIAYGSYSVYRGAQRQRVETMEKELEAARTSMRGEIKRILAELQKQWGTFLTQYLNEQTTGGLAELDASIKDYLARRGVAGDPEKDRLQRQMQGLEAAEKRIGAGVKGRETLAVSVAQVKSDLKGLTAAPGGAARPGLAPGGLGAPRAGAGGMAAARAAAAPAAARPAGPSVAEAKAAATAEARARLEAMKAARAAAAPPKPAATPRPPAESAPSPSPPSAAAPPAAPRPSAVEAFKAKMAALKAAKAAVPAAAPPATAPAAAEAPLPTPAPSAPAPSAPAPEVDLDATIALEMPRPGEAKPSE